ncbi:MAG TPA: 50S ribosomal protein L25/general stress protein Ctc [Desulfobacterales bacterium]|nr:50S ribosomal protein L25/general stress protein Ctc [Desulfobacterales bacterium]
MELIELKTKIRTTTGNGPARRLRMSGQIPAVLYGPKTEAVPLSVDKNDLELLFKKGGIGQVVLNLVIQKNGETLTMPAMIKELQTHPVSRNFIHVDFYEIKMDQKITAKIPVVTTGKAKGIELGGILQIVRREIEVECLPLAVPESIEIDISDLDIGDSIHVRDIKPEGEIEFLEEDDYTVVTVLAPKLEEEEEELEEEEEGEEEEAEKEEGETPEAGGEE